MNRHKLICVIQMADHPCVRMRKVIRSFMHRGIETIYVGCRRGRARGDDIQCERICLPPSIPTASKAKIFYAPLWALSTALYLRFRRPTAVCYAADFEAGMAALLSGRPYIYDVLDTYADRYDIPTILSKLLRWLEGLVSSRSNTLVHVDEVRLSTLPAHPRVIVVRNVPLVGDLPAKRESVAFDIIASGNLDENRGVDQLLEAAYQTGAKIALIGKMSGAVEKKAASIENVRYLGYVDSAQALALTCQSKAVFAAYDPARSINVMASPNKFYDAISCGIPIIVNGEIGVASTVRSNSIGWTFLFGDVDQLVYILRAICSQDSSYISAKESSIKFSANVPYWDEEFAPVLDVAVGMLQ